MLKIRGLIKKINRKLDQKKLELRYGPILKKNLELRNSHKGARCFILGTGPSIKNQDLLKLKNEHTFVVNTFWNHPHYSEIKPKYYVIVDPDVFPKKGESNYWSQNLLENRSRIESYPKTKMFFNILGKKIVEENNLYPNNEKYYLMIGGHFKDNLNFNINIDQAIPQTKNVVIACIMIAAYMGFEEVYLLGCEHDFLAHPTLYSWKHFYEERSVNIHDKNDQKYFSLAKPSYEAQIDQVKILFKNYRLLAEKLSTMKYKVNIYNATPNSFLDVFPPIKFEEIKFDGK